MAWNQMGRKYTGVLKLAHDDVLLSICIGLTKQGLVRAEATAHPEARGDAALDEDPRWHCGLLRLPNLDKGKGYQKHKGEHKQRNSTPLAPLDAVSSTDSRRKRERCGRKSRLETHSIFGATPL